MKKSTVIIIVAVGCVIAGIAPFDIGPAFLANGSVLAQVCLFTAIAYVGVFCSEKSGLQLISTRLRFPVLTAIIITLLVALYISALDWLVVGQLSLRST